MSEPPCLVVITGPTASGKTSLAIEVAAYYSTEIISCDSRQFYRELTIGVARPSPAQLARIPHHMIGFLSIHDSYHVSRFETDVLTLLDNLFQKHRIVVMAGGSGLYLHAITHGIDLLPDPDEALRMELKENYRKYGLPFLQDQLQKLDPEYYHRVDIHNPNRLLRAIEVGLTTGKTYSSLRLNRPKQRSFRIIKAGLDPGREPLYDRINDRVDRMMEEGLLEEAQSLYPFRHLNALNTVGYKELFHYIGQTVSLDHAIDRIKTNTRRYAKRQLTWFRKDEKISWINPGTPDQVIRLIEKSDVTPEGSGFSMKPD